MSTMKNKAMKFLAAAVALNLTGTLFAQKVNDKTRTSVTVMNIDTQGVAWDPKQMGNLVRMELEKLDTFDVMDRYDVSYVIEKNQLKIDNCYGKMCLVEIGSIIKSDKMFTGSVELFGDKIVTTFRLIDVKTSSIEKTQVNEYLNLPKEISSMIQVSIKQMFGLKVEQPLMNYLSKKNNYESSTNNNNADRVNLSGPRSGFAYFFGETGKLLQASTDQGGFNSYPVLFQFGYQFEVQYLNEGDYQALFEFVPTLTGFNQNIFIPSIAVMNGFRNNQNGWEIAFGPTIGFVSKANGYYDAENNWHLSSDWIDMNNPNPFNTTQRLDSRGTPELSASFVVAVGKTIKSGRLNIPVNAYVVPNKEGCRVGLSIGFNAKRPKQPKEEETPIQRKFNSY